MQEFDAETAARIIAENAVSAFLRNRSGPLNLKPDARMLAIGAVMVGETGPERGAVLS
ncbi:hypothetical protein MKK69_10300 [Methylobacterium sp. J-026]|uniref:hypothetical protein n=1 Tax=Methylobacterium sp. J-026 TaxID=2836624 RepID=UPI001FBAC5BD|nr:hypothetical protein [Methylobacterium sp. J-026]MCJ2134438.1 hypothetical protein [Methylobacterium sp. J-026]